MNSVLYRVLRSAGGASSLLALALVMALAACGGAQSSSSASQGSSQGSGVAARAGQAQMPPASGDPEQLFQQASSAWQAGDFASAHRLFGKLYIAVPSYRNGVAAQALNDTCDRLNQDCRLVMIRLDIMKDAFAGRLGGAMNTWVPQQRQAFDDIISCYDHAILGEFQQALPIGARWVSAPIPQFAQAAALCLESAQSAQSAAERYARATSAIEPFDTNFSCISEHRATLMTQYAGGDWEGFVETHSQFEPCAAVLRDILDSGVLEGDPRVAERYDLAWTWLSEIDVIIDDNWDVFEATLQGSLTLRGDAEYNYLQEELTRLQGEKAGIEEQIDSLQVARAHLVGADREQVDGTLRALQSQHESMRRRIHEVQVRQDEIRTQYGLPAIYRR